MSRSSPLPITCETCEGKGRVYGKRPGKSKSGPCPECGGSGCVSTSND